MKMVLLPTAPCLQPFSIGLRASSMSFLFVNIDSSLADINKSYLCKQDRLRIFSLLQANEIVFSGTYFLRGRLLPHVNPIFCFLFYIYYVFLVDMSIQHNCV